VALLGEQDVVVGHLLIDHESDHDLVEWLGARRVLYDVLDVDEGCLLGFLVGVDEDPVVEVVGGGD